MCIKYSRMISLQLTQILHEKHGLKSKCLESVQKKRVFNSKLTES